MCVSRFGRCRLSAIARSLGRQERPRAARGARGFSSYRTKESIGERSHQPRAAAQRREDSADRASCRLPGEEHQLARRAGFRDFQEQVFLKPQLFRRRATAGTRRNALDLIKAIMKNPLELAQIERILRGDPTLNYKLLRHLNSPEMERKVEGWSTRNAISLLGEQGFSRWALLVALVTPATDKTNELVNRPDPRIFCE